MKLKKKLFWLICHYFLKIKVCEVCPEWLCWLFFPLKTYAYKNNFCSYDFLTDTYVFDNVKIPRSLFDQLKENQKCMIDIYYKFGVENKKLVVVDERYFRNDRS